MFWLHCIYVAKYIIYSSRKAIRFVTYVLNSVVVVISVECQRGSQENGSFPLSVKMAALCERVENKSVTVSVREGGGQCDPICKQTDVRVTRLIAG